MLCLHFLFQGSVSPQLSRQAAWDYTYLFISLFLTQRQSCYAMNRFLYILITSTSWCERGPLQICSPSGLISFYPQILVAVVQACILMKMQYGIPVKWCSLACASISTLTAATTIPLIVLLLHLFLPPQQKQQFFLHEYISQKLGLNSNACSLCLYIRCEKL